MTLHCLLGHDAVFGAKLSQHVSICSLHGHQIISNSFIYLHKIA